MKLRKKSKAGDESYWKSFTDIMAALLLIILLILMLLLLYMTQMNKDTHQYDKEYDYSRPYDDNDDNNHDEDHKADEMYDRPHEEGGAGGGGGVDDPGTGTSDGVDNDYGHDKAAVFVTVVDEETGKAIKKAGILFELYNNVDSTGKLQVLHTYYPVKVAYKQYETTKEGVFYLPEKIVYGWYSLHNIKAPKGYSFAEDVNFEITESRDWTDPYHIIVPMSPSKSVIYIQNVDAETKENIGGGTYEVYAEEDVVTLDGTVRYKAGEKVDEFKCDKSGKGASKKLYFGSYSVRQKTTAKYYAVNKTPLEVELNYTESKDKIYQIECRKTRVQVTLTDEQTQEAVVGAVYTVTGKDNVTTDDSGRIILSELEKGTTYTMTLQDLPAPYRTKTTEIAFTVDEDGLINGSTESKVDSTAYIIRLVTSAQDMLFGNEITSDTIRLYDANETIVDEWTATGEKEEFLDLEPGSYTLEVGGNASTRESISLKDTGGIQNLEIRVWTLWDTLAIIAAAVIAALLIALLVSLIRSRRRKKENEEE